MLINHLSYHYPKNHKIIFDDLSINIMPKSINVLLGENGEGKTTLFDVVSGLIRTDAQIHDKVPEKDLIYQIQGVPILSTLCGKDLAELILCSSGQYRFGDMNPHLFEKRMENDRDSFKKVQYLWKMQYGKMSPGERRWFTILLYCLIDKTLYIFDEPTAGVDSYAARQIIEQINLLQEKEGKTIFIATHRIDDLRHFSHFHIHVLSHGKIVLNENERNWIQAAKRVNLPFLNVFADAWINDN
ncbi:AAA family ATPase [Sporolactobacillus nakayamae]|uniref:ABC-2 type transport system ATP-binding protein n=1 Tax=Sporolactobacillus nakayamae TaxID=269670 RepID=A0A1I2RB34_9BACL|nr:AAA family ATPase [Sporolactobacillus nakayamae]SFG37758.1 ABC-2 type transport system ATP-binding protein [Sporolactobacillus nakayamae]